MKLEVNGLKKTFKGKEVLKNISFTLNEGDIVGFIGNNGAGKTTTIKSIFNEYVYNEGKILVNDNPINIDSLKFMEFFPDQNNFPKNFKIKEYCWYNYQLSISNAKKENFEKTFMDLMTAFSLEKNYKDKFYGLSSGMQKRALLASVLITKPKILFLDEPTSNVDVQTKREFIDLLKELAYNQGMVVLITTHQIEELEKFVNRLIFIEDGAIMLDKKFNPEVDDVFKLYDEAFKRDKPIINKKNLKDIFE